MLEKLVLNDLAHCDVMIFHQISDATLRVSRPAFLDNICLNSYRESGLSRNRNRALANATHDICLIADDDVRYNSGFELEVISYHRKFPEADVITFEINERHKKLAKRWFWHNRFSILRANSPTISFKRENIAKLKIGFDENFGIGAKYPSGEENLFLHDCMKENLKLLAVNVPICSHPHESTGEKIDKTILIAKLALYKRIFGSVIALIILLVFAISKRRYYRKYLSITEYLKTLFLNLNRV